MAVAADISPPAHIARLAARRCDFALARTCYDHFDGTRSAWRLRINLCERGRARI